MPIAAEIKPATMSAVTKRPSASRVGSILTTTKNKPIEIKTSAKWRKTSWVIGAYAVPAMNEKTARTRKDRIGKPSGVATNPPPCRVKPRATHMPNSAKSARSRNVGLKPM